MSSLSAERAAAIGLKPTDRECMVVTSGTGRRVAAPASAVAAALERRLRECSGREVRWLVEHSGDGIVTVACTTLSSGRARPDSVASASTDEALRRARAAFRAHVQAAARTGAPIHRRIDYARPSPRFASVADLILGRATLPSEPGPRDTSVRDELLRTARSPMWGLPFGRPDLARRS